MFENELFFFDLQQFALDVFAAQLALVGAGEQFGGAGLGGLVLLLVLFLLLQQVFVVLFGGVLGALGLAAGVFGGGHLRGECGQLGIECV